MEHVLKGSANKTTVVYSACSADVKVLLEELGESYGENHATLLVRTLVGYKLVHTDMKLI